MAATVTFQLGDVAVPRNLLREILRRIDDVYWRAEFAFHYVFISL